MEKCVGSDYMQSQNDTSKTSENPACAHSCLSCNTKEENKCKGCCKISRVRKKIVAQEKSSCPPDENVTTGKTKKEVTGSKSNVLNKHVTESTRQSVQKKTKILKRNVPDRLGKYVSCSVRSDTKLFLGDCKPSIGERFPEESGRSSEMKVGFRETKLAVLGNECLSNKEAVSLSNSFESDMDKKNIFENCFDDCLGSTSNGNVVSSQEISKRSELAEIRVEEKTPEKKKKQEINPPPAPVKVKDHSSYYSSHKNIRHVCSYCQKIFKSNGKLNSHVYSHTGERPFDCSHCGKAFSSKFKLVRHLLIHSEIRKFVCQICDRTFLRNDHLKNHYKVHDPQKKMYKCPKENCDKEYSSMMSHKKHMAYHNVEDGDLKCLICNVKFETKEEVLFHLKSHSGSRLFKSQSDKKFKCEFCDRLFLTRKDVTRHLVVHTGERDFLCQFCPQRFGRKDHLVRHIKKSHRNENLAVKNEPDVKLKEESKKSEDGKLAKSKVALKETSTPGSLSSSKETNTQKEDSKNKTHIVITVQNPKKSLPNRKRTYPETESEKKSFQKNDALVPKKKQVPLTKGKNSTTQILLQNIPNILIIPNNSIILLRNQGEGKQEEKKEESSLVPPDPPPPQPPPDCDPASENFLASPHTSTDSFNMNFNYDFPTPSQFLSGFNDGDSFCNFQPDLPSFGSQFEDSEHLNFEMLSHNDLLRTEIGATSTNNQLTNGNLLTETSRQIKLLETGMNTLGKGEADLEKDLFEDGMLSESILNDFKDESSGMLATSDSDVGILSNILSNQSNDNCGFELLRNLLTNDNPVLSPLPGFSQIFHNSNANSS